MTRKDYERIASAVRDALDCEERNTAQQGISRVAHILAYSLSNENPRFDKERFLEACGFPSLVK